MGELSEMDWENYFREKVTYPEAQEPLDDCFGAYAMATLDGDLFMAFSPGRPLNRKGAMIVRWRSRVSAEAEDAEHGAVFLRAPYEAGLHDMTVIENDELDELWIPGTDYIENTRDPNVASVYSYRNDPERSSNRVVDHRRFIAGEHVYGITGDGANLFVALQRAGGGTTINGSGSSLSVGATHTGGATVLMGDSKGKNWQVLQRFESNEGRAYDVLHLSGSTPRTLFVALDTQELIKGEEGSDGAWSWETVKYNVNPQSRLVDLGNGTLLAVKGGRQLFQLTRAGAASTIVLPSRLQQDNAQYNPLACESGRVVAACEDGIYVAGIDALDTWDHVESLTDVSVGAVCWNGEDRIAYSTLGGVGTVHRRGV